MVLVTNPQMPNLVFSLVVTFDQVEMPLSLRCDDIATHSVFSYIQQQVKASQ